MDGQQRLNTIRDFFAGDFALSTLKVLEPLNGLRYGQCPPRVKRTLDRATISAIVLLMESEAERPAEGQLSMTDIRRLVFDRLNTGGRRLNAQEVRNALNIGPLGQRLIRVYPGFPTIFRGLSGFFVGDLRKRPCGSSWKTRSVFQGAVGALCASTAPSASTGPVRVRQNGSRGGNGELDRRRPRTAVDP